MELKTIHCKPPPLSDQLSFQYSPLRKEEGPAQRESYTVKKIQEED